MKTQGHNASIPLPSPTGSSSVRIYHDDQQGASFPGNATENGCARGQIETPNSKLHEQRCDDGVWSLNGLSPSWTMDSSSLLYLGPDDNSTDPPETLTETSTLTLVDARTMEDLRESRRLQEVAMVYLKEFVLIDDDDDGDMSLREKTVNDSTVMDGRAADLVCGRLLYTSSGSLSEGKGESAAPEAQPARPEELMATSDTKRCCVCTLL